MRIVVAGVLCGAALVATAAAAQPVRQERIQFAKGESSAVVMGRIKGEEIVDYTLTVDSGQSMAVNFNPSNPSAYFNVTAPGADAALFIGSTSGNRFEGDLPTSGAYTIRVYLMRNASRRNESTSYTLEVGIPASAVKPAARAGANPEAYTLPRPAGAATGAPAGGTGSAASAAGAAPSTAGASPGAARATAVPSRWDASGDVQCSAGGATLDKPCGFRVVRDLPKQAADIWIAKLAKTPVEYRFFHYENQVFTTGDGATLVWQRQDDNWWISVDGKEFYLIPDAVIHGG